MTNGILLGALCTVPVTAFAWVWEIEIRLFVVCLLYAGCGPRNRCVLVGVTDPLRFRLAGCCWLWLYRPIRQFSSAVVVEVMEDAISALDV